MGERDDFGGFSEDARLYQAARKSAGWNLSTPIQHLDQRLRHKYREHAGALVDLASNALKLYGMTEGYNLLEERYNLERQHETDLKVAFVICLKFEVYQDREDRVAWWLYEKERESRIGRVTALPLMERME